MRLIDLVSRTSDLRNRQYKTGTLSGVQFSYSRKNKILYVTARIKSASSNIVYKTMLGFKGVDWSTERGGDYIVKYTENGETIWLNQPSALMQVVTRCQCQDFRHRFMWQDKSVKSLHGKAIPYTRVPGSNRPPANPLGDTGWGFCKHELALVKHLRKNYILGRNALVDAYLRKRERKPGEPRK
jgi:hypothetical protein|nr:MAG TPA: hypothetical protein [Bacteriophage sp.]DAT11795.1 MAG TPA: hypothetical protein [Herelleviridae sp.]